MFWLFWDNTGFHDNIYQTTIKVIQYDSPSC